VASGGAPSGARIGLLAALTATAWVALVVAIWGILALLTNGEVIVQADAGPLLGPVMVAAGAVALLLLVLRIMRRAEPPVLAFFGTAAAVYLVMLVVGGIGYALIRGQVLWLLTFPLAYSVSPFVLAAALLAGLSAVLARSIGRAELRGAARPRWPWEDPFDE
jgi:hypothetical protein